MSYSLTARMWEPSQGSSLGKNSSPLFDVVQYFAVRRGRQQSEEAYARNLQHDLQPQAANAALPGGVATEVHHHCIHQIDMRLCTKILEFGFGMLCTAGNSYHGHSR